MKRALRYLLATVLVTVAVGTCLSASCSNIRSGSKSEIDIGSRHEGYIRVRMERKTDKTIKVKTSYVRADGSKAEYIYDLDGSGKWETYPLQSGDGKYTIQVLQNVDGSRYSVIQTETVTVKYTSANAPFLASVQNISYNSDDEAIKKAQELCEDAVSDLDKVERIYNYIVDNIKYDYTKASKIASGEIRTYLPDIDATLSSKSGVCFDFSSLLAAMLRSQGVPTKLSMGYVTMSPKPIYHAWNEVYIQNVGWVRIRSEVYFDGKSWSRMDPTFAAGNSTGVNTKLMSDDKNYSKDKEY